MTKVSYYCTCTVLDEWLIYLLIVCTETDEMSLEATTSALRAVIQKLSSAGSQKVCILENWLQSIHALANKRILWSWFHILTFYKQITGTVDVKYLVWKLDFGIVIWRNFLFNVKTKLLMGIFFFTFSC